MASMTVFAADPFVDLDKMDTAEKHSILRTQVYTPPEITQPLYQAIKDVSDVLKHYEINYWASFGTLLGAVRHKTADGIGGLIPWDDDGDFGVDKKEEDKLKSPALVKTFSDLGYDFFPDETFADMGESKVGYKVYRRETALVGGREVPIFVDLFLFEQESAQYVLSRPQGRAFFKDPWFSVSQIESKVPYNFGGIILDGPSDPESFFLRFYKEEWNDLALHYNNHSDLGAVHYKWRFKSLEDRAPTLPSSPLEERLRALLGRGS